MQRSLREMRVYKFSLLLTIIFAVSGLNALACADSVTLLSGATLQGHVIQVDSGRVKIVYHNDLLAFDRAQVARIDKTPPATVPPTTATSRLPGSDEVLEILAGESWAADLQQIAATVIDTGVMKNVPYRSFKCWGHAEVNVYGDPDKPVAVEIGLYAPLLDQTDARQRCLDFMLRVLKEDVDRKMLNGLPLDEAKATSHGLTVEFTPATAPDAYGAWWLSAYFEEGLDSARASADELAAITTSRKSGLKTDSGPPATSTRSPRSSSKKVVTPPPPSDEASSERATEAEAAALALALSDSERTKSVEPNSAPSATQSTGSVYVRGYYRKNGTYVRPYVRSSPHR